MKNINPIIKYPQKFFNHTFGGISHRNSKDNTSQIQFQKRYYAEGHSLFDMKRQHCMAERLGRAVDDKYYSLPLPQDETDKNPNLKQHPLW